MPTIFTAYEEEKTQKDVRSSTAQSFNYCVSKGDLGDSRQEKLLKMFFSGCVFSGKAMITTCYFKCLSISLIHIK